MTLDPGYYKVKWGEGILATHHYLRVFVRDGKKYCQLDHGPEELVTSDTASRFHDYDYRIVKKLSRTHPPDYQNIKVEVSFEDEEGASYKMIAKSGLILENIFKLFPRLRNKFWP